MNNCTSEWSLKQTRIFLRTFSQQTVLIKHISLFIPVCPESQMRQDSMHSELPMLDSCNSADAISTMTFSLFFRFAAVGFFKIYIKHFKSQKSLK